MDTYLHLLRSKGFKLTPQRRAVIAALEACAPFPTAQDIHRHVKTQAPDVSLDTIYRNLTLLIRLGIVNQINLPGRGGGSVFEIVAGQRHHHHLICLACGQARCIDYCPIVPHELAQAKEQGFTVVSHSLEFYGYCRDCRTAI
ncbi:Fur family transcriptional regulator [Anaeroselena agilis]|uniref:Fur family transcriptional regulator n=1 Tax=Anaeroselena agilis TaxID=3063788 RepID=A0ABU3NVG1_9FIRM|nr:Fur family transcriptional regulator [Selenomonadales bacterium 4137-cl]